MSRKPLNERIARPIIAYRKSRGLARTCQLLVLFGRRGLKSARGLVTNLARQGIDGYALRRISNFHTYLISIPLVPHERRVSSRPRRTRNIRKRAFRFSAFRSADVRFVKECGSVLGFKALSTYS